MKILKMFNRKIFCICCFNNCNLNKNFCTVKNKKIKFNAKYFWVEYSLSTALVKKYGETFFFPHNFIKDIVLAGFQKKANKKRTANKACYLINNITFAHRLLYDDSLKKYYLVLFLGFQKSVRIKPEDLAFSFDEIFILPDIVDPLRSANFGLVLFFNFMVGQPKRGFYNVGPFWGGVILPDSRFDWAPLYKKRFYINWQYHLSMVAAIEGKQKALKTAQIIYAKGAPWNVGDGKIKVSLDIILKFVNDLPEKGTRERIIKQYHRKVLYIPDDLTAFKKTRNWAAFRFMPFVYTWKHPWEDY